MEGKPAGMSALRLGPRVPQSATAQSAPVTPSCHSPHSRSNSASSMIFTPSCCALSSLEPASAPATTSQPVCSLTGVLLQKLSPICLWNDGWFAPLHPANHCCFDLVAEVAM